MIKDFKDTTDGQVGIVEPSNKFVERDSTL